MKAREIVDWITTEFGYIELATPASTIKQNVESAIRYWNTHAAYPIFRMFSFQADTTGFATVSVSNDIKDVVQVYPNDLDDEFLVGHPMYTMLGYLTFDRFSTDVFQLYYTYEAYKIFLNKNFQWEYVTAEDSTGTGTLFIRNAPSLATKVAVQGMKRITASEDIVDDNILDWILHYSKALTKIVEGMTLRKSGMIGVDNDGSDLVREGLEEKDQLQSRLREEGTWAILGFRG